MVLPNGRSITPLTEPNYKCQKCQDRGYIIIDRLTLTVEECECAIKARNLKRLERSGLSDLAKRYTFDSFKTSEDWQKQAKDKALTYLKAPKGAWFFIGGHSGSGKTHLCTAMCNSLINGGADVKYFKWREDTPRIKALINDADRYDAEMKKLSDIQVLYIDDFFKGLVSGGDINFAYQLLNDRYNTQRRTIISSELDIESLMKIDEAIAGRIYEMSKNYCVLAQNVNYWFS